MSKTGRVSAGVALVAVTLAAAFGSVSPAHAKKPDVSSSLMTPGKIVVGMDVPYPPFEFRNRSGLTGFDVQLVKALARELELGVEFRDTGFDTIFTDLSRGKFDLVASATTVTPERKRVVRFTRPNYIPLQSLVTRPRSGIRSLKSLRGATVGVQRGTTGAAFAFRRLKRARIVQFSDVPTAIRALKGGRVDAVVTDQVAVRGTREVRIVRSFSTGEKYAYAVAKASTDLLHGLNWALNRLKRNGTFGKIYRRWFGIAPPPALRYRP